MRTQRQYFIDVDRPAHAFNLSPSRARTAVSISQLPDYLYHHSLFYYK